MSKPPRLAPGFTLLEIVAVIIVLTILVGLIAPMARDLIHQSKAQKILETYKVVKKACMRFYNDVGRYPVENTGTKAAPLTDDTFYQLTRDTGEEDWDGPYLDRSLSWSDNPYDEQVQVGNALDDGTNAFFDLYNDGNGPTGAGNYIAFRGVVSQDVAEIIDETLDKGLPSPDDGGNTWRDVGRVRWAETEAPGAHPLSPNPDQIRIFIFIGQWGPEDS